MSKRKKVFDIGFYDIAKDVLSSSRFVLTVVSSLYNTRIDYPLCEFDCAYTQFIRHKYYMEKNNDVDYGIITLARVSDDLFESTVVYESYVHQSRRCKESLSL